MFYLFLFRTALGCFDIFSEFRPWLALSLIVFEFAVISASLLSSFALEANALPKSERGKLNIKRKYKKRGKQFQDCVLRGTLCLMHVDSHLCFNPVASDLVEALQIKLLSSCTPPGDRTLKFLQQTGGWRACAVY